MPLAEHFVAGRAVVTSAAPRGNVSQAAVDLGLSRQALYRRIEKLGIEPPA